MAESWAVLVYNSGRQPLPRKEHQIQLATEAVAVAPWCVWRWQTLTSACVIHQVSKAYHAQPPSNMYQSTYLILMTYFSLISSKETPNAVHGIQMFLSNVEKDVQAQPCKTVFKRKWIKKNKKKNKCSWHTHKSWIGLNELKNEWEGRYWISSFCQGIMDSSAMDQASSLTWMELRSTEKACL